MIKIFASKTISFLKQKNKDVVDSTRIGMKKAIEQMASSARKNHRYENDTGILERSTIGEVLTPITGRVFINENDAPYGFHVHEGNRSWNPDQFIYKATANSEQIIVDKINAELAKRGIKK